MKSILIIVFFMLISICPAIAQQETTAVEDDKVFKLVEVEAAFPGGLSLWRDFLVKNLKSDVPVKNKAPMGAYTVIVQFIVSMDGTVSNIVAETKEGYGMEQEVIRIISKSGKWLPASQSGRNVNAYRRQPITFVVEDDRIEITTKKMFTLFADTDNRLSLSVKKIKSEKISLEISSGNITPLNSDGDYIIRSVKPGRIILRIINNGNNKLIGEVSMMVIEK